MRVVPKRRLVLQFAKDEQDDNSGGEDQDDLEVSRAEVEELPFAQKVLHF